jgi:hypothetical protein
LYEKDSALSIRCCPKLTDKHINPNGFQKMKVKYATHILNNTVAAAILMYVSLGGLPPSAAGTAEFISTFDNIFDSLNSSKLKCSKLHRRAWSANFLHKQFIPDALAFVKSLKVKNAATGEDVTNRLRCLKGFKITLNSVMLLWQELQQKFSLQFLFTRRLNQDPLENYFGAVRQQGGNSDNPTPIQVSRAFKKLFYDNFLVSSLGNWTKDLDNVLAGTTFTPISSSSSKNASEIDVTDYKSVSLQSNLIGMNAIAYVSGYLLKKCLKKHQCEICRSKLVRDNLVDSSKLFCYFKSYQAQMEKTGGLLAPSTEFLAYITDLEGIFVQVLATIVHKVGLGKSKSLLSNLPNFPFLCVPVFQVSTFSDSS